MPDRAELHVGPAGGLFGGLVVPGDKSVSHRSVMLGSLADGRVRVEGFGASADTLSTVEAFRAMGVSIERPDETTLLIDGVGLRGLRAPKVAIDVGNAGTLIRLLPGLLAGQQGTFTLDGDESIRRRPMGRVAAPLAEMGVAIETTEGLPPVRITGAAHTQPISYRLPVASAQVKSCLLFAGLFAEHGVTTIEEPIPTRDHTERMLRRAGVPVDRRPGRVSISPVTRLDLDELEVPGDFSSAAPFIAAGCVLAGSNLTIQGVGINPTRTGMLVVLERMGARVGLFARRWAGGEPVADIEVEHADLVATEIGPREVPGMIDELPLFALAASMARGDSVVRGAAELRQKESDRIEAVTDALRALGIRIKSSQDGFRVRGVPSRPRGGAMDSGGDHRIAMLGAVAGLVSREGVRIEGAEAVSVSFPGFYDVLSSVTQQ